LDKNKIRKLAGIPEDLNEGKEDLGKIKKLKKERSLSQIKINSILTKLDGLESGLDKFMDMPNMQQQDKNDMRKMLNNIDKLESELDVEHKKKFKLNKEIKTLLGL